MSNLLEGLEEQNHYEILGVTQDSSKTEIEKAFKKLALSTHPDKNHSPDATAQFQRVNTAYTALKDPGARKTYDYELRSGNTEEQRQQTRYPWATGSAYAKAWAKQAEKAEKERDERASWAAYWKKVKEEIKLKVAELVNVDKASEKQKREEVLKKQREEEIEAGRNTFSQRVEAWKKLTREEYKYYFNQYSIFADPVRDKLVDLRERLEARKKLQGELKVSIEKEQIIMSRNLPNVMIVTTTQKEIDDSALVRTTADAQLQRHLMNISKVNLAINVLNGAIKKEQKVLNSLDQQYEEIKNKKRIGHANKAIEFLEAAVQLFYENKMIPAKMERCMDLWKEVTAIDLLAWETSQDLRLLQEQVLEKYDEWCRGDGSGSLFEFNFR